VKIIGVDPGFAHLGFAAVELHHPAGADLLDVLLIETKPSAKKQRLAVADDESRRLSDIEDAAILFLDKHQPELVVIEDPPWGKNAKAVRVCALMWGALHGICRARGVFVLNIGAQLIKKVVAGKNTASKEDVYAAVKATFPHFKGWPQKAAVEHVADAVGAALAIRKHPLVISLANGTAMRLHAERTRGPADRRTTTAT
jgi:Holliday junction resolvasome RuvABC endonuclease subunit